MRAAVDFLIVGQGLAGSALAIQLLNRSKSVCVIDSPDDNISTVVAAGLFNPVTGKNLVPTWMYDKIFPYLFGFYTALEQVSGEKFFFPVRLYRPFLNADERNLWTAKSPGLTTAGLVEEIFVSRHFTEVNDPFGGIVVGNSGYINTRVFLKTVRRLLQERGSFVAEKFDYANLRITGDAVTYGDLKASTVIFCEGVGVSRNPWFSAVPVKPLKGETIQIKCDVRKDVIFNRGVYIVPGSVGEWRVGSTYDFHDKTWQVTDRARDEIVLKLKALFTLPFEITGQDWGFRPTSPDRKPMLGCHPNHKNLLIFNGLGTKGVTLAPYFSEVLVQWILNGGPLQKDVDVSRFKSVY